MAKELSKKQIKEQKKKSKDKKSFGKDFKSELKKVVWPKPADFVKSTGAVIAIVILITVIVFCLDFVFEAMNKYGIDNLRNALQTTEEQNNNNTSEEGTQVEGNSEETTDNTVTEDVSTFENVVENNVQE